MVPTLKTLCFLFKKNYENYQNSLSLMGLKMSGWVRDVGSHHINTKTLTFLFTADKRPCVKIDIKLTYVITIGFC